MNIERLRILVNAAYLLVYPAGVILLGVWLCKTGGGKDSLAAARVRRNNMPVMLGIVILFVWILGVSSLAPAVESAKAERGLQEWQAEALTYVLLGVFEVVLIAGMIFAGWYYFARQLRGFGLSGRNVIGDFWAAILNLAAITPVVAGAVYLVYVIGKALLGEKFVMQQNEGIVDILAYSQWSMRVIIFVFAVIVVPVFEEVLFRGIFQSLLVSIMNRPWAAIIVTSAFFSCLHPWMHWPALFALSVCLGYSYEKSGSLMRPIFIHAIFNAVNLAVAVMQAG